MPIKISSAREIESLIADLGSPGAATRDAAVARLAVIGARGVGRLLALLDCDAAPIARTAALGALERIGDPRALERILDELDSQETSVACAAASAAGAYVRAPQGAAAVDRLTRTAMDTTRNEAVRIAAVRALSELKRSTIAPLLDAMKRDPSEAVRAATNLTSTADPTELMASAAADRLPDDPEELARAVARAGATTSLPQLLLIVERVRERETSESPGRRPAWTSVRGRVHLALASRKSRIAVYDLRESIAGASSPLPVDFVTALTLAGDASCLEPIASAYARWTPPSSTKRNDDDWWRDQLAAAFRTIVRRERLTRRHAVVKRIEKRWRSGFEELWTGRAGKPG